MDSPEPSKLSIPPEQRPTVGLFVTCLLDLFRPSAAFAVVALLERTGVDVHVPRQVCCGQPTYNSGETHTSRILARKVVESMEEYDYVVVPSGSCAAMMRNHYPELLHGEWSNRASKLAERTYELTEFLTAVRPLEELSSRFRGSVAMHDGCHARRELAVYQQPRELLGLLADVSIVELGNQERCCGFGGTFCVKYSEISGDMASHKAKAIREANPDLLVSGDMGCLLNIAGRLRRERCDIPLRHIAEVLADNLDDPPIGYPKEQ